MVAFSGGGCSVRGPYLLSITVLRMQPVVVEVVEGIENVKEHREEEEWQELQKQSDGMEVE